MVHGLDVGMNCDLDGDKVGLLSSRVSDGAGTSDDMDTFGVIYKSPTLIDHINVRF